MRIYCNNINTNGVPISYTRMKAVTQKCESLRAKCLFKLYDMGYIPTPNKLDRVIFKALLQEFKGENVRDIVDYSNGQLDLSSKRVEIAYTRAKGNLKTVFGILLHLSEAEETLKEIEILVNRRIVSEHSPVKPFYNRVSVSTSDVTSRSNIMFNTKYGTDLIEVPKGCKIVRYDFSLVAYLRLCQYLGINSTVVSRYKSENRGLFIKGIPFDMECHALELLIEGSINCDGDYGKKLNDSISEYYYKDFSDDTRVYASDRYNVKIMSLSFNERCKIVEEIRNKRYEGFREVTMSNTSITYWIQDGEDNEDDTVDINKIQCGNYVIDWLKETEFSKINHLRGICGEFISVSDCRKNKLKASGVPTTLSTLVYENGKIREIKTDCYLISQVTNNGLSVRPKLGSTLHMEFSNFEDVLRVARVKSEEEFYRLLTKSIQPTVMLDYNIDDYVSLVSELIILLLRVDSGTLDFKLSRQRVTNVPRKVFIYACYDAERYFNSYLDAIG